MTVLPLTFLLPQALAVALVADVPTLALSIQPPQALPVALVQAVPQLQLRIRQPQALDAALLPILIGPPGPAGAGGEGSASAPVSRSLTWAGGRLVGVTYADGRSKALTWAGDRLTRVDTLRPGLPTLRADLSYNPDGTLAAVTQSEV